MADIYGALRRDIAAALHPKGMSVHSGKVTTRVDLVVHALAKLDTLRAENARLRAALEEAPFPTPLGPYNMQTVQQAEWYNFRHWYHTTRAEALK